YGVAQQISHELSAAPGAVDVHIQQILDSPRIKINTDRQVALQSGFTESDISSNLSFSLAGSGTATQNFWLNSKNGVRYPVVVQTPQYRVDSMDALHRMPVAVAGQGQPQLLSNLATFSRPPPPLSLD